MTATETQASTAVARVLAGYEQVERDFNDEAETVVQAAQATAAALIEEAEEEAGEYKAVLVQMRSFRDTSPQADAFHELVARYAEMEKDLGDPRGYAIYRTKAVAMDRVRSQAQNILRAEGVDASVFWYLVSVLNPDVGGE